jgi:hypothetical protein
VGQHSVQQEAPSQQREARQPPGASHQMPSLPRLRIHPLSRSGTEDAGGLAGEGRAWAPLCKRGSGGPASVLHAWFNASSLTVACSLFMDQGFCM